MAWCASMKKKIVLTSSRSPARTRPRLLTESPALPSAAHSHASGAPALLALQSSDHPCAFLHRAPPASPSSESPVPTARTLPLTARPFDLREPAEPALPATLLNIVFAFPSWTPSNILRCPRNRVNSTLGKEKVDQHDGDRDRRKALLQRTGTKPNDGVDRKVDDQRHDVRERQ